MTTDFTDRRGFLKQGGALLVGISLAGCAAAPARSKRTAPTSIELKPGPPVATRIDTWLAIHEDNSATLYLGFAELGQGTTTALLQVAAEELDLGMDQIRAAPLDTHISPNQGGTYSSASIQRGRPQIAQAAAHARAALLARAAMRLETPAEQLIVERGVVRVANKPRRAVTFGELIGGKRFDLAMTGTAALKPVSAYKLVAQRVPRVDLAAKVNATHTYIQQLRLPGMLHARIVRPRGQPAYGSGARVVKVDETSVQKIDGVRVVRRGDFIGVLAPLEWDAVRAAAQLVVEWDQPQALPGSDALHTQMRAGTALENTVLERGNVRVASGEADVTVVQRGLAPYQAHAPFAPNCALADIRATAGLVICSSQDVYAARRSIAGVLGMQQEQLRVQYAEGSGTYGHSCYDDAAQAAALLSQLAGVPVRLQFMRWDEHGWDTYGPPHVGEVRVSADAAGKLVSYEYHGWQHNWSQV
ncbi:MAG: molybdopterin cofactor-binding domain-containing protein, partial [Pseudomonadota bacterium]